VKNKRPINLNPLTIRLPIMALVSIGHRISGVLVFLLIPMLLWALSLTLASPEGLAQVKDAFSSPIAQLILWGFFAALLFHLLAGTRHLLMDIHLGESLKAGRMSAWLVFLVTICLLVAAIAYLR
jgi:succinate dehydrogenase / fumarate reductase cytochrome b subunit